jgi:hypothetical protein
MKTRGEDQEGRLSYLYIRDARAGCSRGDYVECQCAEICC